MRTRTPVTGTVACLVLSVLVTGCTGAGDGTPEPADTPPTTGDVSTSTLPDGAEVPAFDGPWADELARAYRDSTSDLQRQVLADGAISDQEMAALRDDLTSCLTTRQFTAVTFAEDGGFTLTAPDGLDDPAVQEIVDSCQTAAFGQTDSLYRAMRRNAGNADEWTIMADCLVRTGLAPEGYSAEDYGRDAPADTLPFDKDDPRFGQCIADPLTAGG